MAPLLHISAFYICSQQGCTAVLVRLHILSATHYCRVDSGSCEGLVFFQKIAGACYDMPWMKFFKFVAMPEFEPMIF